MVKEIRLTDPSNILQSNIKRPELWEKADKKNKKVQEWMKILSILSPLRVENKNVAFGQEISWKEIESRYTMPC